MKKCFVWLLIISLMISFSMTTGLAEEEAEESNEGTVEVIENIEDIPDSEEQFSEEPFAPTDLDKMVFGKDDRITVKNPSAHPFGAIAYMSVRGKCGCTWSGSGFMVAKDILLTAAHCVICKKHASWAKTIDFYFGYKSKKNYLYKYSGKWYAWCGNTFKNKEYKSVDDYAAIKLYKNVGDKTGWFGTRWNSSEKDLKNKTFYAAGYRDGKLKYGMGGLELSKYEKNTIYHQIDTEAGNSGGPIFDKNYYAVGIIVSENEIIGVNKGCALTQSVRNAIDYARQRKK